MIKLSLITGLIFCSSLFAFASPPKAVVILVHGLNTKPAKMQSLAQSFRDADMLVRTPRLQGHSGSLVDMQNVSRHQWLIDVYQTYQSARAEADQYRVPLIYVGFSLGGLLGAELLENPNFSDVHWDKMVLLSPAISTQEYLNAFFFLRKVFGPDFIIPSLGSPDYRAYSQGTSVAAYSALFESQDFVQKHDPAALREVPSLVFIDPSDELVSFHGLQNFIASKELSSWKMIAVQKDPGIKYLHHLILDPNCMGHSAYNKMMAQILAFSLSSAD